MRPVVQLTLRGLTAYKSARPGRKEHLCPRFRARVSDLGGLLRIGTTYSALRRSARRQIDVCSSVRDLVEPRTTRICGKLDRVAIVALAVARRVGAVGPAERPREVASAGRAETARVVVVAGAGHLLPLDAPDAVAGAIRDCADALRRAQAPVSPPPDPTPASAWRPGRNSSGRSDISPRSSCNNPDDSLPPGRIARPAGSVSRSAS